jgi:hypothetical protein
MEKQISPSTRPTMRLWAASVEMTIDCLRETENSNRRQESVCGLGVESGAGDGGSAMIAEERGWVDGVAACVAESRR